MDIAKSAHWFQIIGNLGLLIGLALVGLQINQSNTIAEANAAGVYFAKFQDHQMTLMGENLASVRARALTEPEKLSTADLEILKADVNMRISLIEYMTALQQLEVVSPGWRAEIPEHALYLTSNAISREIANAHCFPGRWALGDLCELTLDQGEVPEADQIQYFIDLAEKYARERQD